MQPRAVVPLLAFAALLCAPAPAAGDTLIARYATKGCPASAPEWRIGYRLYWRDSDGARTTKDALPFVVRQAGRFPVDVRSHIGCRARVRLDVLDAGAQAWPQSPKWVEQPRDTRALMRRYGYDGLFFRFPARDISPRLGSNVPDTTNRSYMVARFPQMAHGGVSGAKAPPYLPFSTGLVHQWAHFVVAFYTPRLGWPTGGPDGACLHGYSTSGLCKYDEPYLRHMLNRKVDEDGAPKGLSPDEWAFYGTPRRPGRAAMSVWVRVARERRSSRATAEPVPFPQPPVEGPSENPDVGRMGSE